MKQSIFTSVNSSREMRLSQTSLSTGPPIRKVNEDISKNGGTKMADITAALRKDEKERHMNLFVKVTTYIKD